MKTLEIKVKRNSKGQYTKDSKPTNGFQKGVYQGFGFKKGQKKPIGFGCFKIGHSMLMRLIIWQESDGE